MSLLRRERNTKTNRARRRDDRGAALVEAAIVFVPLCLIIFGIIEYGFVFKDSLTLSSAARAGARTASAQPKQPTFYSDTVAAVETAASAAEFQSGDLLWIYRANANGDTQTPGSCSTDCRSYTWNTSTKKFVGSTSPNTGQWQVSTHQACLGGTMDSVGVRLQLTHKSITGFFDFMENMKLKEHTVMRLEPDESCT